MAGVDEQPPQPRLHAIRVAQPWQLLPGPDEAFLDGVVRAVEVAQDPVGQRIQAIERHRGEGLECVMIPMPCLFHEISVHQVVPFRRPVDRLHKV